MYFVKAGYVTVSLPHLILVEDGRDEPEPKGIPSDVVRATTVTGRVLDFKGQAAEVLRRHVGQVTVRSPEVDPGDVGSREVGGKPAGPGSAGGAAEAV